ncbi:acyl-CoA N-acyltransferase [Aspergillus granulosus]|uniref:Acyl-CoA N-acyltransferase n=1 Tax=Aspergillus granulosus TaxID=176169 RepID=A0ABR4H915_9EURO
MTIIATHTKPPPIPPATRPSHTTLRGRTVTLTRLLPNHAALLFPLFNNDTPDQKALWTYIPDGPYDELDHLEKDLSAKSASSDPLFFTIVDNHGCHDQPGRPVGYIALMNISVEHRRIEIGHVMFSKLLQRTTGATEAVFLLLQYSFDVLGFRRVEWKCNNLNEGSKRAAQRLGFQYEGLFRQHMVVKGRNRDTAWFSIVNGEWEDVKEVLETWLKEGNFDSEGTQVQALGEIREQVKARREEDEQELEKLRTEMSA